MALIANRVEHVCPYCNEEEFSAPNEILLMGHIHRVHSLDPNFSIQRSKDGCAQTFRKSRSQARNIANCTDRKLTQWSGPPSV